MRMTIGNKLIASFLVLAMLVLLSGLVGFLVLNKSSQSADTVAKEKTPVQNAVLNAALSLEQVQRYVTEYISATSGLQALEDNLTAALDEFDMWLAMIQYGTTSDEFQNSRHNAVYSRKNMELVVPKGSEEILTTLEATLKERDRFRSAVTALITSHNRYVNYSVPAGEKYYTLPDFLNLSQLDHLNWLAQLRDAVNIETTFTGLTDPQKGLLGEWFTSSYQTDNPEFADLIAKMQKQHAKLYDLAIKINGKEKYKDKLRLLNRGIGATAKLEKYFREIHELSGTVYQELDTEKKAKQAAMTASADNMNKQFATLIGRAALEMNQALETADKVKSRGTLFLIALTLAAVVIAVVMGTLMSRYLAGRIGDLAEATKKIAAGDLKKTITATSEDELGNLAHDTNSMIANLRDMIGQILSFSTNLSDSSKGLADISSDLDGNAMELSDKATQATGATERMSASMLDIATIANDSMERVQNVAGATEEMSATISEIAENTEHARSVTSSAVITVENTKNKMNDLSEAAKEISKVADVIVNIADQTNLLSLNATIEAARAGEAGKGFAVVANEVKELASQTNMATGDIRDKINAIQQSSDMTIAEISEIAEVINNINSVVVVIAGAVEEQAVTTRQIAEDISTVSSGIRDMTGNIDSATEVAETVASDIAAVSTTSKNVQEGSTHIKDSAAELAQLADELQVLVGKFQL